MADLGAVLPLTSPLSEQVTRVDTHPVVLTARRCLQKVRDTATLRQAKSFVRLLESAARLARSRELIVKASDRAERALRK
jgi:hypothetical protein